MSSMGRGSGAMVYGIVQYDFNAERPDELDAKQGEAIIVIAQSNPEWFVAKPIGRLGGPGLIPVSFIEIKDMATGQTVTDVQGAIARAGVPKVEEWKKMAADYKNSSITLGKFEVSSAASAQRDLERMSLSNGSPQHATNGNSSPFVGSPDSRGCRLLILVRARTSHTINAMRAKQHRMATTGNRNEHSMLLYPHQFQDTALRMTNTGTSSNVSLRMAGIGSCLDTTRIFMTFRSHSFRSSPKKQTRTVAQEYYPTCQARSLTSQMRYPTVVGRV